MKRSWSVAFELSVEFNVPWSKDGAVKRAPLQLSHRSVARALSFDNGPDEEQYLPPVFSASPFYVMTRQRAKKNLVPVSVLGLRRSARQSAKTDGFKSPAAMGTPARKKRKSSKSRTKVQIEEVASGANSEEVPAPFTPVRVLQKIGDFLGI